MLTARQNRKAAKFLAEIQAMPKHEPGVCNCSMRIQLVGDGCAVCNPDYWAEILAEDDVECRE